MVNFSLLSATLFLGCCFYEKEMCKLKTAYVYQFHGHQFESFLLKPLDDLSHQSPLDPVRLDGDEGALCNSSHRPSKEEQELLFQDQQASVIPAPSRVCHQLCYCNDCIGCVCRLSPRDLRWFDKSITPHQGFYKRYKRNLKTIMVCQIQN